MGVAGIAGFFGPGAAEQIEALAARLGRGGRQKPAIASGRDYAIAAVGAEPIQVAGATVVMDGELYNYPLIRKELISEGYKFTAPNSAEVVPYLCEEFGPDGLRVLDGEYAIILADADAQPCLTRDRYGSRSLFYGATAGGGLAAASDPRALEGSVSDVRELPPGAYYYPRTGELVFFDMPHGSAYIDDPVAGAALVRYHLSEAVERRLPQAGPVAVLMDDATAAALVAALAKDAGRDVELFTAVGPGADDRPAWARAVAAHLGAPLVEVGAGPSVDGPAEERVRSILPDASGEAIGRAARTYLLAQAAAGRGRPVVLSSAGAVELFGGPDIAPRATDEETHAALQEAALRRPAGVFRWADRAAAEAGVELRAVYADPNVAMAAWEISPRLKYRGGRSDWLLGSVAERYLPPNLAHPTFDTTRGSQGR